MRCAATIGDPARHQVYLTQVRANRELLATMTAPPPQAPL